MAQISLVRHFIYFRQEELVLPLSQLEIHRVQGQLQLHLIFQSIHGII